MKKETVVLFSGFVLVLVPSLGIPDEWKKVAVVTIGVLLVLLGYLLLRDRFRSGIDLGNGERKTDSFIETTGSLFEDK